MSDLIGTAEVAEIFGVSSQVVSNWTARGKMPEPTAMGLIWKREDVERLKEKREAEAFPYRVWHIPQVPGEAFRVPVKNIAQAALVLKILADYDLFQLEHDIKPDYSNAQGVEERGDTYWSEVDNVDLLLGKETQSVDHP